MTTAEIDARKDAVRQQMWNLMDQRGVVAGEGSAQGRIPNSPEETGLVISELGELVWTRESHFVYRGSHRHRHEEVFRAHVVDTHPATPPKRSANETVGLLGQHWWTLDELDATATKLLPPELPGLVRELLAGTLAAPLHLTR